LMPPDLHCRHHQCTVYSLDAATLTYGSRIKPTFLESRRRSQPGGGFLLRSTRLRLG
jgi:hypothetical protein